MLLRGALRIGERVELVHQPLGMDPTQRVLADIELPGIVTDHHGLAQEAMRADGTPQRALGGDAHRVGGHQGSIRISGVGGTDRGIVGNFTG